MANKLQTKIKLNIKQEDGTRKQKQFTSAENIPGTFLDDVLDSTLNFEESLESRDRKAIKQALRKRYELIADVLFEGQFTADEYVEGMDGREVMDITSKLLNAVIGGPNDAYEEERKK